MLNAISHFFSPPPYDAEESSRKSAILNFILLSSFVIIILSRLLEFLSSGNLAIVILNPLSALGVVLISLYFLARVGHVRLASVIVLLSAWILFFAQAYLSTGIYDTAFIADTILILLAGLLLDYRYSLLLAFLSMFSGWALAFIQVSGGITSSPDTPINIARDYTFIFFLILIVSYLTISGLQTAISKATENSIQVEKANKELLALKAGLEDRIEERTQQLELRIQSSQTQARLLETISAISRSISAVQELEPLLQTISRLIRENFSFLHAGIFLLDETNDAAVLRAASSSTESVTMPIGYKIPIEPDSTLGFAVRKAKSRVSTNLEEEQLVRVYHFLAAAKSELAIPLVAGTRVIGVLDLFSSSADEFDQDYASALSVLANQVAISIQNAQLFGDTRKALQDAENVYNRFIRTGWQKVNKENQNLGYRLKAGRLDAITAGVKPASSIETNLINQSIPEPGVIKVPIKLRGETIGYLDVKTDNATGVLSEDDMAVIQAVADRAALALENARLFEEASNRAERERSLSQVTTRIRSTNNPSEMINIALNELKQVLHVKDARIIPITPPKNQE